MEQIRKILYVKSFIRNLAIRQSFIELIQHFSITITKEN